MNKDKQNNEDLQRNITELNNQLENDPHNEALRIELARLLFSAQNYQDALMHYEWIVSNNPQHAKSHFNAGLCLKQLKRHTKAFEAFTKCIELKPDILANAYVQRASVRDRMEAGIYEDLDKAIQLNPDSLDVYLERAYARLDDTDTRGALEDFHHIVNVRGYDAQLHRAIIGTMMYVDKPQEILQEISEAIKHQPNSADLYLMQSECLWKINRPEDSLASVNRAVEIEPHNPKYLKMRANKVFDHGRFSEAIEELTNVIACLKRIAASDLSKDQKAHFHSALFMRAKSYEETERCANALEDCTVLLNEDLLMNEDLLNLHIGIQVYTWLSISRDYSQYEVLCYRSSLFRKLGNIEAAMADLESALAIRKDDPKVYEEYAELARACGQEEKAYMAEMRCEALKYFKQTEEQVNKIAPRYVADQAPASDEQKRQILKQFVEACDRLLATDPDDLCAWLKRAQTYYDMGRFAEALQGAEKALVFDAEIRQAHSLCFESCYALGDYEAALQHVEPMFMHESSQAKKAAYTLECLSKLKRYDEAIKFWEASREFIDPDSDHIMKSWCYAAVIEFYYDLGKQDEALDMVHEFKRLPVNNKFAFTGSGQPASSEYLLESKALDADKNRMLTDIAEKVDVVFWVRMLSAWFGVEANTSSEFLQYAKALAECLESDVYGFEVENMHDKVFSNPGDIGSKAFWSMIRSSDVSVRSLVVNIELFDCLVNRMQVDAKQQPNLSIEANRAVFLSRVLSRSMRQRLIERIAQNEKEKERAIADARIEERNKVIQDMSHSIKNLVASVVEPLNELSEKYTDDRVVIQKALRGAELIRGTVNALNLSFKGCPDDFVQDARAAATSDHAVSMEHLLLLSLESAVNNMFDGKYFADFCHAYFPTREAFYEAKKAFEAAQKTDDMAVFSEFLKKYLLDFEISDAVGVRALLLDDQRNSPLKITILLQEILLNAVKYACFVPRESRFLRLEARKEGETMFLVIRNAFLPGKSARTTRVGNEIIKNIAHLMGGSVDTRQKDTVYETTLQFPYIWEA